MKKGEGSLAFIVILLLLVMAAPMLYYSDASVTGAAVVKNISQTFTINIVVAVVFILAVVGIIFFLIKRRRSATLQTVLAPEEMKMGQAEQEPEIEPLPNQELLELYIKQAYDAGHSKREIIKALITHNWGKAVVEEAVNRVFSGYQLPLSDNTIEAFVKNAAIRGSTREEITNVMLGKGWPEECVKRAIDEIFWRHRKLLKKHEQKKYKNLESELPELDRHIDSLQDAETPYFEDLDEAQDLNT